MSASADNWPFFCHSSLGVLSGSPIVHSGICSEWHQGLKVCVEHVQQDAITADLYFMSLLQKLTLKRIGVLRSPKRKAQ